MKIKYAKLFAQASGLMIRCQVLAGPTGPWMFLLKDEF